MANFSDDILAEILVRLPAKSIGQFRCVNKPWCKLLKNHDFVQRHLTRATELDKFSLMLSSHEYMISTISYDPLSSTCNDLVKIKCPFRPNSDIQYFGYCKGLVCLSTYSRDVTVLWNPTTQEYRRLPIPRLQSNHYHIRTIEYGFGYDDKIHDFKVVMVASFAYVAGCEVQLYTLRANSWRYLKEYTYGLDEFDHDTSDIQRVTVNGSLYWLATADGIESSEAVVNFHFEKEIFDYVLLPFPTSSSYQIRLCVLGGSLCLIKFTPQVGINVWELNDSTLKTQSAWTESFSIELQKHFGAGVKNLMPLRSLKSGKTLLGLDKADGTFRVVLHDHKDDTTKTISGGVKKCSLSTSVYVESLVSLDSGTYLWQGPMEYEDYPSDEDDDERFKQFNSDKEEEDDDEDDEDDDDDEDDNEEDDNDSEDVDSDEEGGEEDDDEDDEEKYGDDEEDTDKKRKKREDDDKKVIEDIRKMFTSQKKPKKV